MYRCGCRADNASRFAGWIRDRGGVAVWKTLNLSNPGQGWYTPCLSKDGTPVTKPHMYAPNNPDLVVTDPALIEVYWPEEAKRFHVAVKRSSNGLMLKCTDASSARIRREVEKAGVGAYYEFDYMTQECVIFRTAKSVSLKEWMEDR